VNIIRTCGAMAIKQVYRYVVGMLGVVKRESELEATESSSVNPLIVSENTNSGRILAPAWISGIGSVKSIHESPTICW